MAQSPGALHILEFPENNYELHTENIISVLKQVGNCPFAIICMSGRSRVGKSYTLNYFIRVLQNQQSSSYNSSSAQEFKWRKGNDRETVGIYLWSEPYFTTHEGKKVAILLMDAQGLFDDQTTMQQNSVIFSLCGLLSSVCIFNVSQKLEFDTLQNMCFFTEFARAIGYKRNSERNEDDDDDDDDSEGFQSLVIMVRDYVDPEEYGFGYHDNQSAPQNTLGGHRNYYHAKMSSGNRVGERSVEYNAVVKGLRDNYDSIGIALHPDPGNRFKRDPLNNQPEEEYIEKTIEFVELIISDRFLVTKAMDGKQLTGLEFIPFVQHLGDVCKDAKDYFPSAQTLNETTAIMANELALNTAYQLFSENMVRFMLSNENAEDSQLGARYKKTVGEANITFNKFKKVGGKIKEDEYREKLVTKCQAKFERMLEIFSLRRESRRQMKRDAEAMAALDKEKEALRQKGQEDREAFQKLQEETNSLNEKLRQGEAQNAEMTQRIIRAQRSKKKNCNIL